MNRDNLSHLALSDSGFLFDTSTGFTFTLNDVGTAVLKSILANKELEEIVDDVTTRFDIDFEQASHDIHQFASQLDELQLIKQDSKDRSTPNE